MNISLALFKSLSIPGNFVCAKFAKFAKASFAFGWFSSNKSTALSYLSNNVGKLALTVAVAFARRCSKSGKSLRTKSAAFSTFFLTVGK